MKEEERLKALIDKENAVKKSVKNVEATLYKTEKARDIVERVKATEKEKERDRAWKRDRMGR